MSVPENLVCPICFCELKKDGNALKCERRHSYDFASSGYINLLNPSKKNNAKTGDSKEMIRARTSFFKSGAYSKIRDYLIDIIAPFKKDVIIDAGCGEGYYTEGVAEKYPLSTLIGFDMSKHGAEHGAKSSKAKNIENTFYSVSNIFSMPLTDKSADIVISMFAPVSYEEFARVLKSGGYLIIGAAGKRHLDGLKKALYDEVYLNEPSEHSSIEFESAEIKNLAYSVDILGTEVIKSLFTMTPYYHRTTLTDKEKLDSIETLSTTVEVDFFILKRK